MRCIEMGVNYNMATNTCAGLTLTWDVLKYTKISEKIKTFLGLTLTWDVLKLLWITNIKEADRININMRCIEMTEYNNIWTMLYKININMRCIEIS